MNIYRNLRTILLLTVLCLCTSACDINEPLGEILEDAWENHKSHFGGVYKYHMSGPVMFVSGDRLIELNEAVIAKPGWFHSSEKCDVLNIVRSCGDAEYLGTYHRDSAAELGYSICTSCN